MVHLAQQQLLLLLRLGVFGDVAGDLRGADDRPVGRPDWRDRQRDRDQAAVLALAQGLEVVHALALANLGEDHGLFVVPVGRDEHGDRLADRSEEHTSELQSLMRISYAVFCLKKKKTK